jgi:heme-degrading monooxygenase HmoA
MIRVLIERYFASGMEEELRNAEREVRKEAVHNPGYVSGETLIDLADPRHSLVISTWRSQEEWDAWHESEERRASMAHIDSMLEMPERVTVFEIRR